MKWRNWVWLERLCFPHCSHLIHVVANVGASACSNCMSILRRILVSNCASILKNSLFRRKVNKRRCTRVRWNRYNTTYIFGRWTDGEVLSHGRKNLKLFVWRQENEKTPGWPGVLWVAIVPPLVSGCMRARTPTLVLIGAPKNHNILPFKDLQLT
jgi:hypothetical protein